MKREMGILGLVLTLGSCASNDKLFAAYDELNLCQRCAKPLALAMVNATASTDSYIWEPAVYFGFDLDSLEAVEIKRLDQDLEVLMDQPSYQVVLRGFTDAWASVDYNKDLSMRRVTRVKDYLVNQGLSANRIRIVPLDERNPLVGNQGALERAINRHVELMLVDENWQPVRLEIRGAERVIDGPKIDNEPDLPPLERY